MTGKTSELIALLADGRRRCVPEIHAAIGPCRLNSRAAEARKRLRAQGRDLVCTRTPGVAGPEAYSYQIVDGPLREREQGSSGSASEPVSPQRGVVDNRALVSRSLSDPLTRAESKPQSLAVACPGAMTDGLGRSGSPLPSGSVQLSLEEAA